MSAVDCSLRGLKIHGLSDTKECFFFNPLLCSCNNVHIQDISIGVQVIEIPIQKHGDRQYSGTIAAVMKLMCLKLKTHNTCGA